MKIFVDWGTTNLRAWLLDGEGRILRRHESALGIKAAQPKGFPAVFQDVVAQLQAEAGTPALIFGMAGSKKGWLEVPYAHAPVDALALARQVCRVPERADTWLVGGVCCGSDAAHPEVMRGEEIQALGVLQGHPEARSICLPGTHSKWIAADNGQLVGVSTFMTGELFEWLTQHSLISSQITSMEFDAAGFGAGLTLAESSLPFTSALFQLRTQFLFGRVSPEQVHAMASGFLIGREVSAMAPEIAGAVHLCAAPRLTHSYQLAFDHFGLDCIASDSEQTTIAGLLSLWPLLKS
jgi:2-dehydro-3-deoxygalactonokinase